MIDVKNYRNQYEWVNYLSVVLKLKTASPGFPETGSPPGRDQTGRL
jgi:hypothetical protein